MNTRTMLALFSIAALALGAAGFARAGHASSSPAAVVAARPAARDVAAVVTSQQEVAALPGITCPVTRRYCCEHDPVNPIKCISPAQCVTTPSLCP
jgi:hypothetical protein